MTANWCRFRCDFAYFCLIFNWNMNAHLLDTQLIYSKYKKQLNFSDFPILGMYSHFTFLNILFSKYFLPNQIPIPKKPIQAIVQTEVGQYVHFHLFDKDEASDDETLGRWDLITKLFITQQSHPKLKHRKTNSWLISPSHHQFGTWIHTQYIFSSFLDFAFIFILKNSYYISALPLCYEMVVV